MLKRSLDIDHVRNTRDLVLAYAVIFTILLNDQFELKVSSLRF